MKITGLSGLPNQIKRKVATAIKKSNFQKQLRDELVEEIREHGVSPDLKDSTIHRRLYLENYNSTHNKYAAPYSNLTFTGALLESLRTVFVTAKFSINILSSDKKHKAYKKGSKSTATMNQIFKYQKEKGRAITQVFERSRFTNKLSQLLKDAIKGFYQN